MILSNPAPSHSSGSSHQAAGSDNATKNNGKNGGKGQGAFEDDGAFIALTEGGPPVADETGAPVQEIDSPHPPSAPFIIPAKITRSIEVSASGDMGTAQPVSVENTPQKDIAAGLAADTSLVTGPSTKGVATNPLAQASVGKYDGHLRTAPQGLVEEVALQSANTVPGTSGSVKVGEAQVDLDAPSRLADDDITAQPLQLLANGPADAGIQMGSKGQQIVPDPSPIARTLTMSLGKDPVSLTPTAMPIDAAPSVQPERQAIGAAISASPNRPSPTTLPRAEPIETIAMTDRDGIGPVTPNHDSQKPALQTMVPRSQLGQATALKSSSSVFGLPFLSHGDEQSAPVPLLTENTILPSATSGKLVATRPTGAEAGHTPPALQLTEMLEARTLNHGTRFTMDLVPATLGRVSVSVLFKNGQMRVSIRSDRPDALAMLQSDVRLLERSLEPHAPRGGQTVLDFELDHRGRGGGHHTGPSHTDERAGSFAGTGEGDGTDPPLVPFATPKRQAIDDAVSTIDVRM